MRVMKAAIKSQVTQDEWNHIKEKNEKRPVWYVSNDSEDDKMKDSQKAEDKKKDQPNPLDILAKRLNQQTSQKPEEIQKVEPNPLDIFA